MIHASLRSPMVLPCRLRVTIESLEKDNKAQKDLVCVHPPERQLKRS